MTKASLKISLIASDLSQKGAGRWGGGVRPFLIAEALQRLGHQVQIIGLAFDSDSPTLTHPTIPVYPVPCQYYSGFLSASQALFPKLQDSDLIYPIKLKPSSFGLGIIFNFFLKKPLILDIDDWEMSWYGGDNWRYRPNPKQLFRDIFRSNGDLRYIDFPFYLQLMEKLTPYATAITTHTHFLQQRFGGYYVPNGKDTQLFDPTRYDPLASKDKYNLTPYRVIMFPGAPRPYKGIEDVLIALDLLQQEDLRLVIVGGSPYDDFDRTLREKWEKWMIYLPPHPPQQMPEIISASDIIIIPQRDTPMTQAQFPLKLTDGMSMAKPILATAVGDIPEILGETGYIVSPDSPPALAEAIRFIFAHPQEAQEKAQQARQRCQQLFSLDNMADCLDRLIHSLL